MLVGECYRRGNRELELGVKMEKNARRSQGCLRGGKFDIGIHGLSMANRMLVVTVQTTH